MRSAQRVRFLRWMLAAICTGLLALSLTACQPSPSDFPPVLGILPAIHQPGGQGTDYPAPQTPDLEYPLPAYPEPPYPESQYPSIEYPAPEYPGPAYSALPYPAPANPAPVSPAPVGAQPTEDMALESPQKELDGPTEEQQEAVEERCGIRIFQVGLTANDSLLDIRFTVVDPLKAKFLLAQPEYRPQLVSEINGASAIPTPELETLSELQENEAYSLFYSNRQAAFGLGDPVTITIGNLRLEHVVIQ